MDREHLLTINFVFFHIKKPTNQSPQNITEELKDSQEQLNQNNSYYRKKKHKEKQSSALDMQTLLK